MAFDATTELIGIRSSASINTENFTWSTLPALNNHNGVCSIIIDNYLYAIGGSTTSSATAFSGTCERLNLDVLGATWESLPSLPAGIESSIALFNEETGYLHILVGNITGDFSNRDYKLQIKPTLGNAWTQVFDAYAPKYGASDNRNYIYYKDKNYIFVLNSAQTNTDTQNTLSGIYALNIKNGDWYYLGFPVALNLKSMFGAVYNGYLYIGGGFYNTTTTLYNKIHRLNLSILDELYYNPNYLSNIVWEEYVTLPELNYSNCYWADGPYMYYLVNTTTANAGGHIVKRFNIETKTFDDIGVPNFPNTTELHVGGPAYRYKNYIYSLGVRNNTTNNFGINTGYKLHIDRDIEYYGWNFNGSIRAYTEFTSIQSDFVRDNSVVINTPLASLNSDGFSIKNIDGSSIEYLSHRPTLSSFTQIANIASPVMFGNSSPSGTVTASNNGISTTGNTWGFSVAGELWRGMHFKNTPTIWYSNTVAPGWIQYDFGYNFFPTSYRFGTTCITHDKDVIKAFTLLGSNDGVNFTELDTRNNLNLGKSSIYYFKLPSIVNRYRYYRLNVTELKNTAYNVKISSFAVYGYTPEDTNNFKADTAFNALLINKDIQATFPIIIYFATNNLIAPLADLAAVAIQEGIGAPGNYSLDKFSPLSSLVFNITEDWSSYLTSNIATIEATSISGEIFRSLINVPLSTLTGRIVFNIEFNSNITIPIAKLDASNYQDNTFNITITLPASKLTSNLTDLANSIQGALEDLVTVVLNTKTLGHTEYTNYNFNTIVKFNNKYFGCDNTRGIFELSGDTDNDEEINASITTGVNDYLIDEQKRVLDFYLNTRYDGSLNIKTIVDEVTEEIHTLDDSFKQGIHTERVKLSKGLKGRNWQLNITNNNGADFEIESASLLISKGKRRI